MPKIEFPTQRHADVKTSRRPKPDMAQVVSSARYIFNMVYFHTVTSGS
jgi:hypothetical protein